MALYINDQISHIRMNGSFFEFIRVSHITLFQFEIDSFTSSTDSYFAYAIYREVGLLVQHYAPSQECVQCSDKPNIAMTTLASCRCAGLMVNSATGSNDKTFVALYDM